MMQIYRITSRIKTFKGNSKNALLCLHFGWIDSTSKKLPDGRITQRLSPRHKNSHRTKLNMDLYLEDRGLMTPAGRRTFEGIANRNDLR